MNFRHDQLDPILDGFQGFRNLAGHHFFDGETPVFALDQLNQAPYPTARVRKLAEADAPASSCPGRRTEEDIKWLLLKDSGLSSGGIDTVYRVETAGGNKPQTCEGQKTGFEVDYVAQCKWGVLLDGRDSER